MKRTLFEVEIKLCSGGVHFVDIESELEGITDLDGKKIYLKDIRKNFSFDGAGIIVPGMYDKKREHHHDENSMLSEKPNYDIPGFSTIYSRGVVGITELYHEEEESEA